MTVQNHNCLFKIHSLLFQNTIYLSSKKQSKNNRRDYRYFCNLFYKKILFPINIEKRILKTAFL